MIHEKHQNIFWRIGKQVELNVSVRAGGADQHGAN